MAEEEEAPGIPEWVVTFGDMMSLLLTFFIMLVSLSEIKEEKMYQALSESMRKRFGHENSMASFIPGNSTPRNSATSSVSTMGRAKKLDTKQGGDKVKAPTGDNPRVRIIRPGKRTAVGTLVTFDEGSVGLDDAAKTAIELQASEMNGKPQKIEIRGHTTRRPGGEGTGGDNWDLAYKRCRETMSFLVSLGINEKRIRMSVAGANEPQHIGTDPEKMRGNPRVEVYMLDEVVSDLSGTASEREERTSD